MTALSGTLVTSKSVHRMQVESTSTCIGVPWLELVVEVMDSFNYVAMD